MSFVCMFTWQAEILYNYMYTSDHSSSGSKFLYFRCASLFNVSSQEISSHICNTAIVEKVKGQQEQRDGDIEGTEEEDYIDWSFEGL